MVNNSFGGFEPVNLYPKNAHGWTHGFQRNIGGNNHFSKVLNMDILRLSSISLQSVRVWIFFSSTKVVCPFSDTPPLEIWSIFWYTRVLYHQCSAYMITHWKK